VGGFSSQMKTICTKKIKRENQGRKQKVKENEYKKGSGWRNTTQNAEVYLISGVRPQEDPRCTVEDRQEGGSGPEGIGI